MCILCTDERAMYTMPSLQPIFSIYSLTRLNIVCTLALCTGSFCLRAVNLLADLLHTPEKQPGSKINKRE